MADRIAAENEERQKKEAEMADRLKQAQEVRVDQRQLQIRREETEERGRDGRQT